MADRLVELDGGSVTLQDESVPTEEQVQACLADLVEVARIKTLHNLGDGPAGLDRGRRWLATKAVCAAERSGPATQGTRCLGPSRQQRPRFLSEASRVRD